MISYSTILIASAIGSLPVILWAWLLAKYNRKHQRGASFLMNIFFLGVLSAVPASVLEIILSESDSQNQIILAMQDLWSLSYGSTIMAAFISAAIVAFIEEFSKGIAILIAVFSKKFKIHNDGLIFGGLVGLAFAVTENGVYFASALSGETASGVSSIVILRFFLSTTAHIIYSGVVGKYLADARLATNKEEKIKYGALAFFLPTSIHTVFNLLLSTKFNMLVVVIIAGGSYSLWHLYSGQSLERESKKVD